MKTQKHLWIGMVFLGACARLIPHPWNFTPMMAIGLFAGYQGRKPSAGVLVTLLALALSDAVLGFYPGFWYVYAAALVPVLLGWLIRNRTSAGAIAAAALASGLSFFFITNFGVFLRAYPNTLAGFMKCYTMALPFFGRTLAGDLITTAVLFGLHAWLTRAVYPPERVALAEAQA